MAYKLNGTLLEVCSCNVLCPCWIGEDPDGGTCKASLAYHFDKGEIDGVDVSGLTVGFSSFIPGNVLDGNWRCCVYVSEEASDEQFDAITRAWKGELGGPIAELCELVGELVSIERAPITFEVSEGGGTYRIGDVVDAELKAYEGPTGKPTTLVESIFSTIPGSPAYVGKAGRFRMKNPALDLDVDIKDHNAISGPFSMEA